MFINVIKIQILIVKKDDEKEKDGKEKDKEKENQGEGDMDKSEKSSNISGFIFFNKWLILMFFLLAASVNEDLRQLKDFKALISEKTVPKSIKILKRTVWILVMILIILTG